jgi:hypothetical protein
LQKNERITSAKIRGVETPGVNQHRSVSDKVPVANRIRQQWDSAKCDSMANCAETKHFASLT